MYMYLNNTYFTANARKENPVKPSSPTTPPPIRRTTFLVKNSALKRPPPHHRRIGPPPTPSLTPSSTLARNRLPKTPGFLHLQRTSLDTNGSRAGNSGGRADWAGFTTPARILGASVHNDWHHEERDDDCRGRGEGRGIGSPPMEFSAKLDDIHYDCAAPALNRSLSLNDVSFPGDDQDDYAR